MEDYTGGILGGGALAIIVIREVLNFLKEKKENGNGRKIPGEFQKLAGEQSIEFWNQQMGLVVTNAIRQDLSPLLATAIANLTELQKSSASQANSMQMLTELTKSVMQDTKEVKDEARSAKAAVHEEAREMIEKVNEVQRSIDKMPFKRME